MVGGGVRGKVIGIAHVIITGAGFIIKMFQVFILMWTRVGEDITETIIGTGTAGTISGFLTDNFKRTGRAGIIIDIGKGKEPGVSRIINLDRNNRDRNSDIKGKSNTGRGRRFRDSSNNINHRFSRLSGSGNQDSLKFNSSNINHRFSDPRNSILNPGASNARGNHDANNLQENMKEEMKDIEGRKTQMRKEEL
jgi:hypothetical protein